MDECKPLPLKRVLRLTKSLLRMRDIPAGTIKTDTTDTTTSMLRFPMSSPMSRASQNTGCHIILHIVDNNQYDEVRKTA